MIFNSFAYLLFLPAVFLIYWLVCRNRNSRNWFIVGASWFFYGWWSWKFLSLLILSTVCSFASGLLIGKMLDGQKRKKAKIFLTANIILNLGVLFLFKYFDFFTSSFTALFDAFGIHLDWVSLNLVLPIGISFYTFQALSYSIDVYRGDMAPTRDAGAFFAYISFFPQLVAGPIERATNLIPQFSRTQTFSYSDGVEGMKMILWGLFKKMLVADNCAIAANYVFGNYENVGSLTLWYGVFMFSMQIYGDFSGYSDIAIGSARLFGIRLMQNFHTPYFSRSIKEFWRRWHISLSSWLRDYLYYPLGGSRCGKHRHARNLFIVFLASGLWHGANFTFLCWGAYQAIFIIPGIYQKRLGKVDVNYSRAKHFAAISCTFIIVMIGWMVFRAPDMATAADFLIRMFSGIAGNNLPEKSALIWVAVLLSSDFFMQDRRHGLDFPEKGIWKYRAFRWLTYVVLFMAVLIFSGSEKQFIYFQF